MHDDCRERVFLRSNNDRTIATENHRSQERSQSKQSRFIRRGWLRLAGILGVVLVVAYLSRRGGFNRRRMLVAGGVALLAAAGVIALRGGDIVSFGHFIRAPRDGRFLFDLGGYLADRITRAGIATVEVVAHDTVAEEEHFFSYRRCCLRGERFFGLGLSAIVLKE